MKRILLALLFCSAAQAEMTVTPSKAPVGTRVVAKVSADVPEGATFDGGWDITGEGKLAKLSIPNAVGVWGPAGEYTITYRGFWLLLKDVTFKDGDGNVITIKSYLGHGQVDESATLVLEGDDGPDPPPPPPPPVGPWKIVLFYESSQLDNLTRDQQAILRGEWVKGQLRERGHELVQRIQGIPTQYPADLREYVEAVRGKSLPRVALQGFEGGTVFSYEMPKTWDMFVKMLSDKRLKEPK